LSRRWNIFLKSRLVHICVLSKLIFVAPFLDLNKEEKKKLESAFGKALWGKETGTRLSKEQAWRLREEGGLGMVDIIAWL
jgi:hypothetical protein